MIIDSNYQASISGANSKITTIYVEKRKYGGLEQLSGNEYGLVLGMQGDLVIDASNITNSPSASDLELKEREEDLLIAQKSHLEYLSGTGRPFNEFLAELHNEEGASGVSS
jgi:hypothetical protein